VLARIALAENELGALSELCAGGLRISSFSSANVSLMPKAIANFAAAYPSVELELVGGDPALHLEAVEQGELDLALVSEWDVPDERVIGVRLVHVLDDPVLLALPAGHRLAQRRQIALSDLAGERWIEGAHPDCLGPISRLWSADEVPQIAFVCDDWSGKQGLVAAGVGITLFPRSALAGAHPNIILRTVKEIAQRGVYAACRAETSQPPALAPMLEFIQARAAELAARPAIGHGPQLFS
jgi:DNA-binding transcriptional LysR family regulator